MPTQETVWLRLCRAVFIPVVINFHALMRTTQHERKVSIELP